MTGPGAGRQGVAAAVLGFAAGLILSAITASIAEAVVGYHPGHGGPIPIGVTAANLVGLWAGLVGGAVWWSRKRGTGSLVRDYGYRLGAWWDIPVGVAVGLGCQFGLIPLLYLPFEQVDHKLSHQLGQQTRNEVGAAHTSLTVLVVLLFIAIGAPLVEELFFRGLLLRSLAEWVNPVAAVIMSGLLFALAHFETLQFAGLAVFGIILGVMAWQFGRLGPGIAAHMSFNFAAVISTVKIH
jgi:membrane protease YdiL (CAAX protease family)